jgi:hypothetical protein
MRRVSTVGLCVLLASGVATAAPGFDGQRLFTTAEQRERLDRLRARPQAGQASSGGGGQAASPGPSEGEPVELIELRGYIRRSDGPSTYWINATSSTVGGDLPDEIPIDAARIEGASVVVELPDGSEVRLQPGQRWQPSTGDVVERYAR